MSLSRPTAEKITRKFSCTAVLCAGLIGLAAAPALASDGGLAVVSEATNAVSSAPAVCPGQTFSQPFTGLGDSNYYTLVPGSEFNSSSEGWQLIGGAHVLSATRPDGSPGSVLDMPSGSIAVSPPVCVTLQYPTARIWANAVTGKSNVVVSVVYANTRSLSFPKQVSVLQGEASGESSGWGLSEPFNVQPELGGKVEETRQVRFIFAAGGRGSETQLYGLYVDPRMS